MAPIVLNDVHSQLNPTPLKQILRPRNDEELCAMLRDYASRQQPLCVMGARHAMGGQQFLHAGTAIDTSALSGVVDFDGARGQVVVRGGTRWPQLLQRLQVSPSNSSGWTIRQKQTGADDFSIGGSIAANIHRRSLRFSALVEDLEWIDVMRADGSVERASRNENDGLFSLVVGGYGLFGVVVSACLPLQRGSTPVRQVQLVDLSRQMPGETLQREIAFDPTAPTLVIAEGLAMYLEAATVLGCVDSLRTAVSHGTPVRLLATARQARALRPPGFQHQGRWIDWWLRRGGEAFQWASRVNSEVTR